jgi:hypothetical protein
MSLSRRKFLKYLGVAGAAATVAPSALVVEPKAGAPAGPVAKLADKIFRRAGLRGIIEKRSKQADSAFKDAYAVEVKKATQKLAQQVEKEVFSAANREDLLDCITNIDPWETPWFSQAARGPSKGDYHEWLADTLNCPSCGAPWENDGCGHCGRTFRTFPHSKKPLEKYEPVTIYESDFGTIRIVTKRSMDEKSGAPLTEADFNAMLEDIYVNGGNPEVIEVTPALKRELMRHADNPGRLQLQPKAKGSGHS